MKRLPQLAHSPVTTPESSVEKLRGPPHSRQGFARGAANPRSRSRPRNSPTGPRRGSRAAAPVRYSTAVPQEEQAAFAKSVVQVRRTRGEPHSPHGGPGTAGGRPRAAVSPTSAGESPWAPSVPRSWSSPSATSPGWTTVKVPPHEAQVPWTARTARGENSAAAPHPGHVDVMTRPHQWPWALFSYPPPPRVPRAAARSCGAERDVATIVGREEPAPTSYPAPGPRVQVARSALSSS